ncbi:MAG TPA: hypothetical protein VGP68_01070 [Gemmataceae bacterium]|jgi:hypothetical protein|nr:hypothetical protein [Gemmataceae bacterium]
MAVAAAQRTLPERALEVLRRAGNPFRNYFARNPDDEVCARYHVPELFATERDQILGVVDLYRYDPNTHSEVVPVLGNKGSGKTHLLHTIKHGGEGAWQVLVTPGVYQKDTDFLEYLLFQMIDTVLGGGKQKGTRPLEFVGEELVRRLFHEALTAAPADQRLGLFPAPGLGRWTRKLGLGAAQAQERTQYLLDQLGQNASMAMVGSLRRACTEVSLDPTSACTFVCDHIERTAAHNTGGLMRRHIHQGFVRSVLLGEDTELANFLTFGFAELEFRVRPSRQDLVLALFKGLMEVFLSLKIPVVVAFDQLEDLLLARRTDDGHRVAEAFFAGIVQAMHQIDGLCFLVFAERGLWNRFVPSLDGYIQDRLNNPIHVPRHGTIKALRLEAPPPGLARRVVEARMRPALEELPDFTELPAIYPFNDEQVERIARTEPTLRDMLQQYRHLFDHLVYGTSPQSAVEREISPAPRIELPAESEPAPAVKSVMVVETPASAKQIVEEKPAEPAKVVASKPKPRPRSGGATIGRESWDQEMAAAMTKIESEGALTGATRELQAGLGAFLMACHEHGVKVGPWRLRHVVPEWTFGDHPTYGAISIGHWVCKEGQPWKVGVGLFLGRGVAKPKDLAIKLAAFDAEPPVIDHLILLRPEDDLVLSGKSKTLWQDAEKKSHHARLEAAPLSSFAVLYGFPRWQSAFAEAVPAGQPVPNFADLLQERCEKLLEQVCMPIQG